MATQTLNMGTQNTEHTAANDQSSCSLRGHRVQVMLDCCTEAYGHRGLAEVTWSDLLLLLDKEAVVVDVFLEVARARGEHVFLRFELDCTRGHVDKLDQLLSSQA